MSQHESKTSYNLRSEYEKRVVIHPLQFQFLNNLAHYRILWMRKEICDCVRNGF